MLKTLRIVDIHEVLRERISINKHVILMKNLEVFRVLYWLLYLAHIMGCAFYIISCDEFGVPLRDSFITENNLIDRDVFERYWVTVYQVVVTVTTVGYGDIEIAFVNGAEMSFLCLLMIVSSVLYVNLFSFLCHPFTQTQLQIRIHACCDSFLSRVSNDTRRCTDVGTHDCVGQNERCM